MDGQQDCLLGNAQAKLGDFPSPIGTEQSLGCPPTQRCQTDFGLSWLKRTYPFTPFRAIGVSSIANSVVSPSIQNSYHALFLPLPWYYSIYLVRCRTITTTHHSHYCTSSQKQVNADDLVTVDGNH